MNVMIHNETCLTPKGAVIFYRGHDDSQTASTFHRIDKNGELGAGKNLDVDDLEELFRSNGKCSMNFLPSNVLAVKNNSIVWYEKSRKHPIYFRPTENKRQKLGKYSGREIIWPSLLFMVSRGGLYCWALKSNRRPTPQTRLFQAPLTHINEDNGHVCTPAGLTLRHGASPFEHMKSVSEQFYEGTFGHGTGSMKQINHPGGHDGFWLEYLRKKKNIRFPTELLKPTNKKLEDILR